MPNALCPPKSLFKINIFNHLNLPLPVTAKNLCPFHKHFHWSFLLMWAQNKNKSAIVTDVIYIKQKKFIITKKFNVTTVFSRSNDLRKKVKKNLLIIKFLTKYFPRLFWFNTVHICCHTSHLSLRKTVEYHKKDSTTLTVALIRRILGKQGDYSGEREFVVLDGYAAVGFLVYEFIDEISSRVWVETYI